MASSYLDPFRKYRQPYIQHSDACDDGVGRKRLKCRQLKCLNYFGPAHGAVTHTSQTKATAIIVEDDVGKEARGGWLCSYLLARYRWRGQRYYSLYGDIYRKRLGEMPKWLELEQNYWTEHRVQIYHVPKLIIKNNDIRPFQQHSVVKEVPYHVARSTTNLLTVPKPGTRALRPSSFSIPTRRYNTLQPTIRRHNRPLNWKSNFPWIHCRCVRSRHWFSNYCNWYNNAWMSICLPS